MLKYDIFITGTFRNDWSKSFNLKLEKSLSKHFSCYLPQRDTPQKGNRKETFKSNCAGIDNSKILLAIGTKTQTANWGFEIGYAYKSKKPIIILTTKEDGVELMPEGAAHVFVAKNIDDIDTYFDELVKLIKKQL